VLPQALMNGSPLTWAESFDVWLYKATIRQANGLAPCTAQAAGFAAFNAVQAAAIVIVGLFNIFLAKVAVRLAKFERHLTVGGQENAVAFKVFVGQFANTFLVSRAADAGPHSRSSDWATLRRALREA
jgi:hypothetical protein